MAGALLDLNEMLALMRRRLGERAAPSPETAAAWARPHRRAEAPEGWPTPIKVRGVKRRLYYRVQVERYIERIEAAASG